ncbi:MAG TPA: hypothetical protein V6D18_03625 [Thermosynechococcaceae cyanobacterium]
MLQSIGLLKSPLRLQFDRLGSTLSLSQATNPVSFKVDRFSDRWVEFNAFGWRWKRQLT